MLQAFFHHVMEKVARAENTSVTSREQTWGQQASKHQHEPKNITIKKLEVHN